MSARYAGSINTEPMMGLIIATACVKNRKKLTCMHVNEHMYVFGIALQLTTKQLEMKK